ncbi:MAG TPA: VWA domain-containing protein [Pyrinomonadaceae bacterium]|jgi:VWFA-related protein|nr:VWA domain-containing protein [Pyrinomonadaceae bacterium]
MNLRGLLLFCLISLAVGAADVRAQSGVRPRPTPAPKPQDDDVESVYAEEVRLAVFAFDEKGRSDPRLEVDDVLVVEDGVPQQVSSVRRMPASVVLLLATGWDLNPALRANNTRDIALGFLRDLRDGDQVAALQFNGRTQLLQDWTTDRAAAARTIKSKLVSGEGSNLSQAVRRAVELLQTKPAGNRHLVLVTDGIDTATSNEYSEAVRRLNAAQATLHVISYTEVTRADLKERERPKEAPGITQSRADMATVGIDPTRPPGMRSAGGINPPSVNSGMRIDPAMRRRRKMAEREMRRGEERLKSLAEETGGNVLVPATVEEMVARGGDVAREIDAQYVVTYRPKRRLRDAPASEFRRLHVGARRLGLTLRARRGYLVGPMRQAPKPPMEEVKKEG